jgi:hypothetical protein
MQNGNAKILGLDFDGVAHHYRKGWEGASVVNDGPTPGVAEFLSEAVTCFRVAIYSSRSNQPGGVLAMAGAVRGWLADSLGEEHAEEVFAKIEWPTEKPPAFVSLDDRVIRFTGVWPTMQELLSFKPWNKRPPLNVAVSDMLPAQQVAIRETFRCAYSLMVAGVLYNNPELQLRGRAVTDALRAAWPELGMTFGDIEADGADGA